MNEPFEYINTITKAIVERVNPEKVILFGSYAYGTPSKESDIDILVILKDSSLPRYKRSGDLYTMSERIDLARSWFQVANEDILTADQLMQYEDPVLRSVCFHCQQAVEKYIKGLIIYLDGDFSYTHDISRLLDELRKYEKDLSLEDLEPDSWLRMR